ncbi:sortase [Nocardioides marmorisolisilvae]|uniref:Sortase n=1 Tax=Nocardioides marmorisolisilvae TaxID=1542737 RepID=A0A3N0DWJ1_9ACTN|nr:sortase [Nocardioides marmorisolisilvae]RNL79980.1 sortase [Nocardioides marmorisolisilvae]
MTTTFQESRSRWGRNNPLPGLTRNLPRVTRIPESERRPSALVDASYGLTVLALVLFTLLLNLTVISQIQHFTAQHRLYGELRRSLAEGSTPIGQLDDKNNPIKPGTPIALLKIPELGISEVVVEGSASRQTKLGVGHQPNTPFPGQGGSPAVLFGRKAAYGGVFANLDRLRAGQEFTVLTGQGKFTYRVIGQRTGEKVPAMTPTSGRLTLVTAKGAAFMPHGVLQVDADLVSKTVPRPPIAYSRVDANQGALGSDHSRMFSLSWLLELLVLMAVGSVWAWKRWSHPAMWVVFVPVLAATGLACADRVCDLLPNLM